MTRKSTRNLAVEQLESREVPADINPVQVQAPVLPPVIHVTAETIVQPDGSLLEKVSATSDGPVIGLGLQLNWKAGLSLLNTPTSPIGSLGIGSSGRAVGTTETPNAVVYAVFDQNGNLNLSGEQFEALFSATNDPMPFELQITSNQFGVILMTTDKFFASF